MNEKVKNTILVFMLGLVIGSAVTFFFYQRASSKRIEQYRATELTIIEDNLRLRSELSSAEDGLRQYKSLNSNARAILSKQGSSIEKLRAIIESLPD